MRTSALTHSREDTVKAITAIIVIAAFFAFTAMIFVGFKEAASGDSADYAQASAETAQAQAAAEAEANEKAATDGRVTVKSRSYACDSRWEASMFVRLAKDEQYEGNSDVNAMLDDDVHQGHCKWLYPGEAMVITHDPQVEDEDLSVVKLQGNDHEYFTPTVLLTQINSSTPAPPPGWTNADVVRAPAATVDPAAAGYGNDSYNDAPVTKAEAESYRDAARANVRGTINRPIEACESHGGDCVTLPPGTKVILDVPSTDETTAWFEIANPAGDQPHTLVSTSSSAITLD